MFEERKAARQAKRLEAMQRKNEELQQKCTDLASEKRILENELEAMRETIKRAEAAEIEFRKSIEEAREAKAKYDKAFGELKLLRRNYTAEVKSLIKDIKSKQ